MRQAFYAANYSALLPKLPTTEKVLLLPGDFAHRQEVRLLGRHLGRLTREAEGEAQSHLRGQFLAPLFVLRLWLFWSGKGTAHRAWLEQQRPTPNSEQQRPTPNAQRPTPKEEGDGKSETGHPYQNDPLVFLIAEALHWSEFLKLLPNLVPSSESPSLDVGSWALGVGRCSDFLPIALALHAGVLIETFPVSPSPLLPVSESCPPGLTLAGFADYNAHLAPGYKPMQRRGGEAKARFAALRNAANDATSQRLLLAQSAFAFPSDQQPTEAELNDATGLILQFHCALDAAIPATDEQRARAGWTPSLFADALHLIRTHSRETQLAAAEYVMTHRHQPPLTEATPEYCLRHFASLAARAAEGR